MKNATITVLIVFFVGWGAGAVAQNSQDIGGANVNESDIEVEVMPGESISLILIRYMGSSAAMEALEAVQQYNNIKEPRELVAGATLRIPAELISGELIPDRGAEQQSSVSLSSDCDERELCFQEAVIPAANEAQQADTAQTLQSEVDIVEESVSQQVVPADDSSVATGSPDTGSGVDEEFTDTMSSRAVPPTDNADLPGESREEMQSEKPTSDSLPTDDSENPNESVESPKPRGPGLFEVDEDAAVRALEHSLVRIDALLLRPGEFEASLDVSLAYLRQVNAALIDIEDVDGNVSTTVGETEAIRTRYSAIAGLSAGMGYDTQIDIQLPLERISSEDNILEYGVEIGGSSSSATGNGDIRLTLLKTLLREEGRRPDVIARIAVDTDTGGSSSGIELGSNNTEWTLGISATKRQDPLVFVYGLSHTMAGKKSGLQPGSTTQLNAGTLLAASPYTSLSFVFDYSVTGDAVLDGTKLRGSGGTAGSFTIGVSSVVSRSVFLSAGVNTGLSGDSADYNFYLGFSKRY